MFSWTPNVPAQIHKPFSSHRDREIASLFRGKFNLEIINFHAQVSSKPFIHKINSTFVNGLWMKIIVFVSLPLLFTLSLISCRSRLNTKQERKSLWKIIDLELWKLFLWMKLYDVCEWRFFSVGFAVGVWTRGKYLVSFVSNYTVRKKRVN